MFAFFRRLLRRSFAPAHHHAEPLLDLPRRRAHAPTAGELLAELKNTAWTCAALNAAACAAHPPRLFRRRRDGAALSVEEVRDHPLLDLLAQVNPVHNQFDLLELTQLALEIHGIAYWLLEGAGGPRTPPVRIWPLPAHLVVPVRDPGSPRLLDRYEYRGATPRTFAPETILAFRCPDPRDPYLGGLSPLRACFEQAALASEFAAMKRTLYENAGLPSALLTPTEGIAADERDRLERAWHQRFSGGGHGQALVTDVDFKVTLLSRSLGDLAALADMKATKEDIANAFGVPLPFLSGATNLANMQAADHLHKTLAILPRLRRRDDKLNEVLVPLFDPAGSLYLASDDPTPRNRAFALAQEKADLALGVRTINEVRAARGLAPVAWGDAPYGKRAVVAEASGPKTNEE